MKRQERQHLKENELAHTIGAARDFAATRSRQIGMLLGVVGLVVVAVFAFMFIQGRGDAQADAALAEAMVALNARVVPPSDPDAADLPESAQLGAQGTFATEAAKLRAAIPKLKAAADAHPEKEAGIIARYHLAGALAALGRNDEALAELRTVADKAPSDSLYRRMARLGLADTQARAGQVDAAIESWKELADENNPDMPIDAILLELGRAYAAKGNAEEARKTFNQLIEQHPASPYLTDARTSLDELKG